MQQQQNATMSRQAASTRTEDAAANSSPPFYRCGSGSGTHSHSQSHRCLPQLACYLIVPALRFPCSRLHRFARPAMSTPRITRYQPIARLTSPITAEHFHTHYVATNTPVILPADPNTSSTDWSLPRLQSLLGSLTMNNVFRSTDGRYTFFDPRRHSAGAPKDGLQRQKMTFDEFVRSAGHSADSGKRGEEEATDEQKESDTVHHSSPSTSRCYLYGEPLPVPLEPLLPPPTILASTRSLSSSLLWVAVDGSISPLHYDLSDGLLCQLHHSKHLLLLPPQHYHTLAPHPINHAHDRQSQLTFHTRPPRPQPQLHGEEGRPAGLEGWVGEVCAGEMLYLPYGWWHQIESEGECVSVTYRWDEYQQQLQQIRAVRHNTPLPATASTACEWPPQLTCVCVCVAV